MGITPFTVYGNTVPISANTAAIAGTQVPSTTLGANQYRIINPSTVVVFLGFGSNATNSQASATTPTGTVVNCLPLLPGTDEILSFQPNAWFSAMVSSGANTTIYITPGDGA
jgi:hypothetical protein